MASLGAKGTTGAEGRETKRPSDDMENRACRPLEVGAGLTFVECGGRPT